MYNAVENIFFNISSFVGNIFLPFLSSNWHFLFLIVQGMHVLILTKLFLLLFQFQLTRIVSGYFPSLLNILQIGRSYMRMIACFRLLDHFSFWYLQFLDTFSTCSSDGLPFLFPLLFSQQVVTYSPYFLTKWSLIGALFPLLFQHVVSYSLFYSLSIDSP
jgi:hypothetical protein